MTEKYYVGLDIGTDSVGWAVTNQQYEILKFNGKLMIGSRLFDSANTAAEQRIFRSNAILLAARTLKYRELINYSLWLRLGIYYDMIDDISLDTIYYMTSVGKSSHLKQLYENSNYYRNVDEIRANVIRDILKK